MSTEPGCLEASAAPAAERSERECTGMPAKRRRRLAVDHQTSLTSSAIKNNLRGCSDTMRQAGMISKRYPYSQEYFNQPSSSGLRSSHLVAVWRTNTQLPPGTLLLEEDYRMGVLDEVSSADDSLHQSTEAIRAQISLGSSDYNLSGQNSLVLGTPDHDKLNESATIAQTLGREFGPRYRVSAGPASTLSYNLPSIPDQDILDSVDFELSPLITKDAEPAVPLVTADVEALQLFSRTLLPPGSSQSRLQDRLETMTRREAAACFAKALELHMHGVISLVQSEPYEDIKICRGERY